jgi:hypothetical protein
MKDRYVQFNLSAAICLFLTIYHLDKQQQRLTKDGTHEADLHPTDPLITLQRAG